MNLNSKIKDPIQITVWDGKTVILPKQTLSKVPFFDKYWNKNPDKNSFQLLYPYSEFKYILKYLKDDIPYWEENQSLKKIFNFLFSDQDLLLSISGWNYKISSNFLKKAQYFESFLDRWVEREKDPSTEYDLFIDEEPESFLDFLKSLEDANHIFMEENLNLIEYYSAPMPKKLMKYPEINPNPNPNPNSDFNLPLPTGDVNGHLSYEISSLTLSSYESNLGRSKHNYGSSTEVIYSSNNLNSSENLFFNLRSTSAPTEINLLLIFETLPDNFNIGILYGLFSDIEIQYGGYMYNSLEGSILKVLEEAFYNESYQKLLKNVENRKLSYIIPLRSDFIRFMHNNPTIYTPYQQTLIRIEKNNKYLRYNPYLQVYALMTRNNSPPIDRSNVTENQNRLMCYLSNELTHTKYHLNNSGGCIDLQFNHVTPGLMIFRISKDDPNTYLPIDSLNLIMNNIIIIACDKNINIINKEFLGFGYLNPNVFVMSFDKKIKDIYYNAEAMSKSDGCINLSRIDSLKLQYQFPDNQPSSIFIINFSTNVYMWDAHTTMFDRKY
jgi:hypothetical protein